MKNIQLNIVCWNTFLLLWIFVACTAADSCISCTANERDCTVDPLNIKKAVNCDFKQQVCYTKLDSQGRNERGCTDINGCEETKGCLPCRHKYCNVDIYPFKRPVCYECNGTSCADPSINHKAELCQYYSTNIRHDCFFTRNEFVVKRGCMAGARPEDFKCEGFNTNCSTTECAHLLQNKSKPCNNFTVELQYKCYQCNSKENSQCMDQFTNSQHEICKEYKGCYERFSDGTAYRGCASSLTNDEYNQCKQNISCRHCDSPVCNFEKINGAELLAYSKITFILSVLSIWKLV